MFTKKLKLLYPLYSFHISQKFKLKQRGMTVMRKHIRASVLTGLAVDGPVSLDVTLSVQATYRQIRQYKEVGVRERS
jgi:hypothetical protein